VSDAEASIDLRPHGRFRRALGGLLRTVAISALFLGATATAVVLHLDLPPTRRFVVQTVNELLGSLFQGRIIAEEIDRITLHGVDIRSAIVLDPAGVQVIRASGIHARADVIQLVRGALFGKGELLIDLPTVQVDDAAVLVEGAPGKRIPSLAETFLLRAPSKPPVPGARPVRVVLRKIEITHAWAHGLLAPPRMLDADISRLAASLQVGSEGVALDVEQTGVLDRSLLPWPVAGSANYHLRISPPEEMGAAGAPGTARIQHWMGFSGQLARVEVQARATLEGSRLTGRVEVPRATPEEVASIVPNLPLQAPVSLSAALDGLIPSFSIDGRVNVEGKEGSVAFDGRLDASGPTVLELDATARGLDAGVIVPVQASPVDIDARVRVELGQILRLMIEARSGAFAIAGTYVPPAEIHAILDHHGWIGSAHLDDTGLPIDTSFSFTDHDGLAFFAAAEIDAIQRAPRLVIPLEGAARLTVEGTLRSGVLDAKARSLFSGVRAPGEVRVGYGGFEGHVNGPISRPEALEVDASLWGRDLTAAGYEFDTLKARARGPLLRPQVDADLHNGPSEGQGDALHASAELDPKGRGVRKVKVNIRRGGTEIGGTIARIGAAPGGLGLEGISLSGAGVGEIKGGLVVRGGELSGKMHGEAVQLERLVKLAGIRQLLHGLAAFDVELTPTRKGRKGHAQVELANGEYGLLHGVAALINLRFDDDKVTSDGLIRLLAHDTSTGPAVDRCEGTIAQIRLDGGAGVLSGRLLDRRSWEQIAGKVEVSADDWDLHCLSEIAPLSLISRFVPAAGVPSEVRGKLSTRFTVERAEARRFPSIHDLSIRTNNIQVIGPPSVDPASPGPAWASTDVDLQIKGNLDGESGHADASLTLYDGEILGDVSLQTTLDLATLLDQPTRRWASLKAAPIEGRLSVPRRKVASFSTLPSFLRDRIPPLAGEIRLDGYIDGSLELPFAALHLGGFGVAYAPESGPAGGAWVLPVDLDTLVTYDAKQVALAAHVVHDGKEIAAADGEITLGLDDLLAGHTEAWTGGVHATFKDAPIGELPFLADRDIGGHLSGTIAASGLHGQPKIDVELVAPDLRIGQDLFFDEGKLSLVIAPRPGADASDDHALGLVKLGLSSQDGGRLDAQAFAGIQWNKGLDPSLDREAIADLYAKLDRFRLAALHPLVSDILSKLDGSVDGELRVGWKRLGAAKRGTVEAKLKVHDGVFHVPQLGQELRKAEISIVSEPEREIEGGKTELPRLLLEGIRAEGTRGLITGKGMAHIDGLIFHDAEASLSIARGDEIPLTIEGVPVGNARGEIKLVVEKQDREIRGTLSLPSFHLDLPPDSGRAVQPLEDNPAITILQPLGPAKEPRSPDALRYVIGIDLGYIEIAGNVIEVALTRQPTEPLELELRDKLRITGGVAITSGKLSVVGKEFKIEHGLVRFPPKDVSARLDPLFRPETSNPYVNVRASWSGAPAGTHIYVDYVGLINPITRDKLKFSADPPVPEAQILAMLLGASDQSGSSVANAGQQSGQSASAQQLVSGVAADIAAQQFNTALASALSGSILQGISAQLSTTEEGLIRTGVAYSLSDKLRAVATYEGGTSTTATSTTTAGSTATGRGARTQISLDWRFLPNWLLRSTFSFGDQTSSGIDMLWQYRY
jgi:translocation and assembly module TamB